MKALILAAGLGTRLGTLTKDTPKVMIDVGGKPCLQHHIENLGNQGITDIAINTHYFPERITDYFGDGSRFGVKIKYSYEDGLLGTSGALNNFRDMFKDETFVIVYGDVVANFDVGSALYNHTKNHAEATIVLDAKRDKTGKGLVEVLGDKVIGFSEKPEHPNENHLINSGFYVIEPSVLDRIPKNFSDFGRDILPAIAREGKLYCSRHRGYIFDIGTEKDLHAARAFFETI